MDGPPWRVAIADDRTLQRRLMRFALQRDPRFEVLGEACSGREALLLAQQQPDAMIIDVHLGLEDGVGVAAACAGAAPQARVCLCSTDGPPPRRPRTLGFLSKQELAAWTERLAADLLLRERMQLV